MAKRAGILIIGNEILSGKTIDANTPYLCRELRALGVEVRDVQVIPDEVDVIAERARHLSQAYDLVFTSGGVGPTHDDVTIEGIAKAFGKKVVRHPHLADILKKWYGHETNEDRLKMAEMPEGSELRGGEKLSYPVVVCGNVYIFPGIPEILREKFEALKESFREDPFHLRIVYVKTPEGKLAAHMNQLVAEYPELLVGSYPEMNNPRYHVKVTLESKNFQYLEEACKRFLDGLPTDAVVSVES